jgi:hypothetical protein
VDKEKVVYTKEQVSELSNVLKNMGEKQDEVLRSKRAVIKTLIDDIMQLHDKGYSFNEIAELLTSKGVKISPATLKQYVYDDDIKKPVKKPVKNRKTVDVVTHKVAVDDEKKQAVKPSPMFGINPDREL